MWGGATGTFQIKVGQIYSTETLRCNVSTALKLIKKKSVNQSVSKSINLLRIDPLSVTQCTPVETCSVWIWWWLSITWISFNWLSVLAFSSDRGGVVGDFTPLYRDHEIMRSIRRHYVLSPVISPGVLTATWAHCTLACTSFVQSDWMGLSWLIMGGWQLSALREIRKDTLKSSTLTFIIIYYVGVLPLVTDDKLWSAEPRGVLNM